MEEALKEARLAFLEGEVPVGAIVVKDGLIIGRGHNQREANLDISSHAEIKAMKEAAKKLGRWDLSDCSLYVTLEPCLMCTGAILQARIHYLCFGALNPNDGAICSKYHVFDQENACMSPFFDKKVLEQECQGILMKFFQQQRR